MNVRCFCGSIWLRRCAPVALLFGLFLASAGIGQSSNAANEVERVVVVPGRAQQVIQLRDRLVVGLQARLKTEVAFVDAVVAKVRTGKVPQRVVDQTFFWARDRASARVNGQAQRPIIYFQPAMKARAKRLRVEL